jgi:hypothetical protein
MPYFIRAWFRRRLWRRYAEVNRSVRKVEISLNSIDARLWPVDHIALSAELDRLLRRSSVIRDKLTQEV